MAIDKTDKNGDLHDGNTGRYKSKSAAEMSRELAVPLSKDPLTVVDARDVLKKHHIFTDAKSVDEFFLYDDEKRGLLYKKNSSHGKWESKLTPNQRYTLSEYTADGYSNINSFLRGYDNGNSYSIDFVKKQISELDKAIADYDLRESIITYRSINSTAFSEFLDDMSTLVGTEYSDPAFMSTSPTLDSSALNKDLLMTIKLPKGKGIGAFIAEHSGLKDETEFLLARNSKFVITKAYKDKNTYKIELELVK